MHGYIMEMWALHYFLYQSQWHSGPAVGGGGAAHLQVKNLWGDHFKFKNQCHFQYDTTKS